MNERLEWIQKMPEDQWRAFKEITEARADGKINRREWLKVLGVGGAAMAGGAAATGSAMGEADPNDSIGDVGTRSNPVDVFADGIEVGSSPGYREIISDGDRTIYVDPNNGSDSATGGSGDPVATIQEALERVPLYLRHRWDIDLTTEPGTPVTYNEDLNVPAHIATQTAAQSDGGVNEGPQTQLRIIGDTATPSNVEISSMVYSSPLGGNSPRIRGVRWTGETPYDDESASVSIYGGSSVFLLNNEFDGTIATAVQCRDAVVRLRDVDFGTVDLGLDAKSTSLVRAQNCAGSPTNSYKANGGSIVNITNDQTGVRPFAQNGGVISEDNRIRYGDSLQGGKVWGGYSDEVGSRTDGTWYQNTTGEPLHVIVHGRTNTANQTDMNMVLRVNSSQTDRTVDAYRNTYSTSDSVGTVSAIVPRSHYYKLEKFGDTGNYDLGRWYEQ